MQGDLVETKIFSDEVGPSPQQTIACMGVMSGVGVDDRPPKFLSRFFYKLFLLKPIFRRVRFIYGKWILTFHGFVFQLCTSSKSMSTAERIFGRIFAILARQKSLHPPSRA